MLLSHLLVGAGVLFRGTLGLSPPYTTPECRVGDPSAACPTYANCYGTAGCGASGCAGICAPTSSCAVGYTNYTCQAAGQTCTPFYTTCTTPGCFGACINGPPPTPTPTSGECMISNSVYTCSQSSYCAATWQCSTSGCVGKCQPTPTPVIPCRISDPASACPQGMFCTRTGRCEQTWSGCFGSCTLTSGTPTVSPPTFSPTPTYEPCMIDDPLFTCSNTQSSYCSPTGTCTTSRCGGQCQPSPTGTTRCVISDPVSTCSEGMTCTQTERCTTGLSGCGGTCTRTYSPPTNSPTPTLRGCKIGDLTSTCSPIDSYTCTPTSPCTTTGCGGLCLSLNPQPTLRGCRIGDPTSTCSPGESSTCSPTSPCTTTGCYGVCASIGASPTVITDPPFTDTNTPDPSCTDTNTPDPTVITDPPPTNTNTPNPTVITDPPPTNTNTPDLTEPPLKTRTYDCLVSVTSQCLPGYNCEPWYGQCCDSLNCPGRCVKESTECRVETKEVLVTTTVTVWHSEHGNGH